MSLMPMWLAPNLITIIGLAVNVFTSLVHLYYCPTATEAVSHCVIHQFDEKKNSFLSVTRHHHQVTFHLATLGTKSYAHNLTNYG